MVEEALKSMDGSVIKISELKRKLPKKVNHNVLKVILEYLEQSCKISVSLKGITWVRNNSERMNLALQKSSGYPKDFSK